MKVVITGGTGFIGARLARRIVDKGTLAGPDGTQMPVDEVVLFDVMAPAPLPMQLDGQVTLVTGDISDRATIDGLIDRDDISVFHLASVVSGGGEKDFDLAISVNLTGGINIFEALRARASTPRLVFASSIAVFGGDHMPDVVGDHGKQTPQTTYGMTKACCELLINDYTRKGFLDGRSARLPTVIVRPGAPNAAASSFASGVFREPLKGEPCALPVKPETVMPVLGYRNIVEGILALHELPPDKLGDDRAVSLPSMDVTVAEMVDALKRVAHNRKLGEITVEPDPFIEAIVQSWPVATDDTRALALGLPKDTSLDDIVRHYIEDYDHG
ncbi:MAG: D-erythronate dehydrogenase [Pseudomonadota bacterium]